MCDQASRTAAQTNCSYHGYQLEEKRKAGTPVSVANFKAWKFRFKVETDEKDAAKNQRKDAKKVKLTGRQLFEQDESLAASDLVDETEDVVDTSQFERVSVYMYDDEDDNDNGISQSILNDRD